jgi:hypothetical protein
MSDPAEVPWRKRVLFTADQLGSCFKEILDEARSKQNGQELFHQQRMDRGTQRPGSSSRPQFPKIAVGIFDVERIAFAVGMVAGILDSRPRLFKIL